MRLCFVLVYDQGNLLRGIVNCSGLAESVKHTWATVSVTNFSLFQLEKPHPSFTNNVGQIWFPFRKKKLEKKYVKNCNCVLLRREKTVLKSLSTDGFVFNAP